MLFVLKHLQSPSLCFLRLLENWCHAAVGFPRPLWASHAAAVVHHADTWNQNCPIYWADDLLGENQILVNITDDIPCYRSVRISGDIGRLRQGHAAYFFVPLPNIWNKKYSVTGPPTCSLEPSALRPKTNPIEKQIEKYGGALLTLVTHLTQTNKGHVPCIPVWIKVLKLIHSIYISFSTIINLLPLIMPSEDVVFI